MSSEALVPVEELLEVEVVASAVTYLDSTACRSELSVVHIVYRSASCLIYSKTCVYSECEILEESDVNVTVSCECITL